MDLSVIVGIAFGLGLFATMIFLFRYTARESEEYYAAVREAKVLHQRAWELGVDLSKRERQYSSIKALVEEWRVIVQDLQKTKEQSSS